MLNLIQRARNPSRGVSLSSREIWGNPTYGNLLNCRPGIYGSSAFFLRDGERERERGRGSNWDDSSCWTWRYLVGGSLRRQRSTLQARRSPSSLSVAPGGAYKVHHNCLSLSLSHSPFLSIFYLFLLSLYFLSFFLSLFLSLSRYLYSLHFSTLSFLSFSARNINLNTTTSKLLYLYCP